MAHYHTIKGKITDRDGKPLSEVLFSAGPEGKRNCQPSWHGVTGDDGCFEWIDASNQAFQFQFYKEGFQRLEINLSPQEEIYQITLRPPLVISGTVVDAMTGQPIPKFEVIPGLAFESMDGGPIWIRRNTINGSEGKFSISLDHPYPSHFIRIIAEGYEPAVSRAFKSDEDQPTWEFVLNKGEVLVRRIVDDKGQPVAGAEILLATPRNRALIHNGRPDRDQQAEYLKTSEDGIIHLNPQNEPFRIFVMHDQGYAEISDAEYRSEKVFILQPWGRIKGIARIGLCPASDARISLLPSKLESQSKIPHSFPQYYTKCGENGEFTIERVFPAQWTLSRVEEIDRGHNGGSIINANMLHVTVASGETMDVEIGGKGCRVRGRVVVPENTDEKIDFNNTSHFLYGAPRIPEEIRNLYAVDAEEAERRRNEWRNSEEVINASKKAKYYEYNMDDDGSFQIDDVEDGDYLMEIQVFEASSRKLDRVTVGYIEHHFNVPKMLGGRSDEIIDLGNLPLVLINPLKPGKSIEAFNLSNNRGELFSTSDYMGKIVLLSFEFYCPQKPESYRETYDNILKMLSGIQNESDDLVILWIDMYSQLGREIELTPGQGIIIHCSCTSEEYKRVLDKRYFHNLPLQIALDRDGKILATSNDNENILEVVRKALGR